MKPLFILLFLTLSCKTYSQLIKRAHFATDTKCGTSQYPDWNCGCVFDNQLRNIGDLTFKGTNGGSYFSFCQVGPYECRLTLPAITSQNGTKSNAGFLVSYQFKQNYHYTINVFATGANYAYLYGPSSAPSDIYPALSAQLTNGEPGFQDPCMQGTYVSSVPTSNPYFSSFPQIIVTPNICYSSLWIVTEANDAECDCRVIFDSIRIEESLPDVSIVHRGYDPDAICSSNAYRVLINGADPPPNSVNWTISNISPTTGTIVSSVTNGNFITVNKVSTGTIQLSASINSCVSPSITATQTITVGTPKPVFQNLTYGSGQTFVATVTPAPTVGYSWSFNNAPYSNSAGNTYSGWVDNCNVTYNLNCQAENTCGASAITTIKVRSPCTGPQRLPSSSTQLSNVDTERNETTDIIETTIVYPNPTSKTISVSLPAIGSSKTSIKIYDLSGKQLKNIIATSQTTNINIANLANGIYIVEVFDGVTSVKKKIVKN